MKENIGLILMAIIMWFMVKSIKEQAFHDGAMYGAEKATEICIDTFKVIYKRDMNAIIEKVKQEHYNQNRK